MTWESVADGDLPEMGVPVLGYHPSWIDEDFNKDGIRECFRSGDGWISSIWVDYQDFFATSLTDAPSHWMPRPTPPETSS